MRIFDFSGLRAVVTGASRGIGLACASLLGKHGAECVMIGTNEAKLKQESVKIPGASYIVCDASNDDDITSMCNACKEADILINNAGITADGFMIRMTQDQWDSVFDVNVRFAFKITKHFVKGMMRKKYGRIVFTSSVVGATGNAGQCNYSSSKSALYGLSKSIALEFASKNITCNTVSPGFIDTDMTASLPESIKEKVKSNIPLGRYGDVEDIANAVLFLASREAGYITGTNLHVNGGLYM